MSASIVSRVAFWIGTVAAAGIPLTPPIYRWFNPPRTQRVDPQGFWETVGALTDALGSFTDGLAMFVCVSGLTALAVLASVVAFIAALVAQLSWQKQTLCGLPVLLAAAGWLLLIALG
jgi:hypothetical protein